jgi:hypothetical protein
LPDEGRCADSARVGGRKPSLPLDPSGDSADAETNAVRVESIWAVSSRVEAVLMTLALGRVHSGARNNPVTRVPARKWDPLTTILRNVPGRL